jgi:putative ABC transport system permease protein
MPSEFFTNLWLRIKALALRSKLHRDLQDELDFHLAMRQQKFERAGLPPSEASEAARRRFGNSTLRRETLRSLWTFAWVDSLGRDLRYACRTMARAPLFTVVAVATLAFGIGANTAIFSIVNGVLLRAMPYERPSDLYSIREAVQEGSQRHVLSAVNGGNALEWTRRAHSFQSIALMRPSDDTIVMGSESVNVHGLSASASLFPLLGIRPRIGRSFTPEEDEMGHGMEIVLTDALWRERFAANREIVGRSISLNGYPATVIGVLPASFYFPKQGQIYNTPIAQWTSGVEYFGNLNLGSWDRKPGISNFNFAAFGRVLPGVPRQRALAELETIEAAIGRQETSEVSLHAELVPLKTAVVGPAESRVWMLMAGAGLVLIIVCVNLAGLMLGRNAARSREVAIRLALGAGRWTVLRQFAAEGLALAATGGAIGVAGAFLGVQLLVRYAPISLPRLESVTVDGSVLAFSAAIALMAGVLCSLLPALRAQDRDIEDTLRSTAASVTSSRRTAFVHRLLAGSEIALCTVLLICALLLGQSLSRVLRDNAWLNDERVLTVDIAPSPKQYQDASARTGVYRKLLQEVRALPGVTSAGLVSALPLKGEVWDQNVDILEVPTPDAKQPTANIRFISPGYDSAIGLAPVAGRSLQESDWGRDLVLVSESLARQYPGRNLVGMHLQWPRPGSGKMLSLEVAGVLRDVRANAEETPVLAVYIPYWIWPPWGPSVVVRSATDPAGIAASVQKMMHASYAEIPVTHVETLRQLLSGAVASRRFLTQLGVVFAASAVFLAALGLYGAIALAAARRRQEIAIRMAVGASRPVVFRMVIGQAARVTLAGVAVGAFCGMQFERAITSLLYDVRPADPPIYVAACAIVIAVASLASFLPAMRAARVDPLAALKYE